MERILGFLDEPLIMWKFLYVKRDTMKRIAAWLAAILIFAGSFFSSPAFAYQQASPGLLTITDFEILEDPKGEFSFYEAAVLKGDKEYTVYKEDFLSLGIQSSVYWVRFTLPHFNKYNHRGGEFLQLKNPNIDKMNVYIPTIKGYVEKEIGVGRPGGNKEIVHNTWVFSLPEDYLETQPVYLRLESTSALRLPVLLWQKEAFLEDAFFNYSGFGSFYGILTAMFLFNLFVYIMLRERVYLYYIIYIFCMFFYQFQVHGHLKMFIDMPYLLHNAVFWLFLGGAQVSSVYFTREFLQLKHSTFGNRLLTGILLLTGIQTFCGLFHWNIWANQLAHVLGLGGTLVMMALAIRRWHEGFKAARYYLLAWGVLFVGIVFWVLSAYVVLPFPAVNYLLVGTVSETLLLSFALADRVKILRHTTQVLGEKVKHFRDLSRVDELTGLYNKRSMHQLLYTEMEKSEMGQGHLVMMVLDIDHFKQYNDKFGHWAGDEVLKQTGNLLLTILRKEDMAFRYGGEEFVVALPDSSVEKATNLAERIREELRKHPFEPVVNQKEYVTVSIGLADYMPGDTLETLFLRADEALYKAKNTGRNQVCYA